MWMPLSSNSVSVLREQLETMERDFYGITGNTGDKTSNRQPTANNDIARALGLPDLPEPPGLLGQSGGQGGPNEPNEKSVLQNVLSGIQLLSNPGTALAAGKGVAGFASNYALNIGVIIIGILLILGAFLMMTRQTERN